MIQYRKLKDLILENKKSHLQVRSSSDLGAYIFFTSGEKTRRTDKKLVDGENIYLATGGKAYVQYYDGEASYSTDCYSITTVKTLAECKYLYYFLISKIDKINEEMFEGAALKHLQKKKLLNCDLLLPPLPIQQKIVAKLDKIFAEIDKATAAVESNVKNAEVLFKNYLTKVFENYEDADYLDKTINEVCLKVTDGKHGDCTNEDNSGYYFLSAKDIKNGVLNYKKARQITKTDFEETHRRTNLEVGDILLTNSGTIGRMAIALNQTETTRTTFQKSVAIIKPIKNQVYNKFLFYLLSSKLVHFNNLSAGTAQKNLLLRDIRSLKIKIPKTIEEQVKKVGKCDFMKEQIMKFSNNYLEKLENFNKLKQSILKQAFDGRLVKAA